MGLSAIILTKDGNDPKLKNAMESVKFADEIIVAKEKFPVEDFSQARNSALDKAKGEWVLFVDSDEVVGEELGDEVIKKIKMNEDWEKRGKRRYIDGYFLKRRDRFLGKWLRFGETAGVRLLRLARKDAGRWERPVHEVWKVKGRVGGLKNPLLHYSHDSVEEMAEKLDRYSEIEGEYKLRRWAPVVRSPLPWSTSTRRGVATTGFGRTGDFFRGKKSGPSEKFAGLQILVEMILFPVGKFVWNYFFRLGFLDGMEGFIHAGMMSGHSFLVRAKVLNALIR